MKEADAGSSGHVINGQPWMGRSSTALPGPWMTPGSRARRGGEGRPECPRLGPQREGWTGVNERDIPDDTGIAGGTARAA